MAPHRVVSVFKRAKADIFIVLAGTGHMVSAEYHFLSIDVGIIPKSPRKILGLRARFR